MKETWTLSNADVIQVLRIFRAVMITDGDKDLTVNELEIKV